MRCPRCGCQEDRVIDSRASKDGAAVRRRRECTACGHRFTTHEEIIQAELKVVNATIRGRISTRTRSVPGSRKPAGNAT